MSQLAELQAGEKKILKGFKDPRIGLRLLSMGIQPGAEICVRRSTINGQTLYVRANGKNIALRKKEASKIQVQ
ncbi:MAG: ferrous iron transport protein A [Bacteroidetes bacterium]|jgi:Fe2+ transport system protein FeoA|nr:ferrous iron transport protein A [Bacteroidota bacterium]